MIWYEFFYHSVIDFALNSKNRKQDDNKFVEEIEINQAHIILNTLWKMLIYTMPATYLDHG